MTSRVTLPIIILILHTGSANADSSSLSRSHVSFESLLEQNLVQHPELQAYQKEVEAARTRGQDAFWLGDTSVSVARTGAEVPLGNGSGAQTEYGITQNFSLPGKNQSLTKIAKIEADLAKVDFEKKRRQIEKETAFFYAQISSLTQKANIAHKKLLTLNAAKMVTSRNIRSGLGVPVDDNLIEREIELTQLQVEQVGIEQSQKISEIETKLPGTKIGTPETLDPTIPRSYFQRRSSEAGNLSLRAFSLDFDRVVSESNLRRQSVWPDFTLNLTRKNEKAYDVTLGLTIPLWYPFKQSKQIASATDIAQAKEMRFDYQKQIAPLTEALLRTKIQGLKHQLEGRRRIVRMISEPTLKQSRTLFERGRIDWKQLQLAVDAVFQDQEALVDLDLTLFSAELDLYELLGVIE